MIAAITLVVIVVGVVAGSAVLGRPRVVSGTVAIAASPEVVYELVSDLKTGWPLWSPLMPARGGVVLEYGPQTSGPGASVSWTGRAGAGSLHLVECAADFGLSYRTQMSLAGMSASGNIEWKRDPAATLVAWRDALDAGSNPLWRWLALALDGLRHNNVKRGLAALKRECEQRAADREERADAME